MSDWNFDLSSAPRGETITVSTLMKDGTYVVRDRHQPVTIIAAGTDNVVTLSKWNPKEERWSMFTKAAPPIAWRPWPAHPCEATP